MRLPSASELMERREREEIANSITHALGTALAIVAAFFLIAWYASLRTTSAPLNIEQRQTVERAINVLQQRGFTTEAFLLRRITTYRATDHWWNQQFGHPQAYAATNFPYEVMTLYPEFARGG